MTTTGLARASLLAGLAALFLATVVASAAGGVVAKNEASRDRAKPGWQHLADLDHGHGAGLATVAWAAGRVWFVVGSQRQLAVSSARVQGGRLASPKTSREQAPLMWYPVVAGSALAYSTTRSTMGVAAFRPDGGLGPTESAAPDPMESKVGSPVAAARVGERIVWVLAGGRPVGEGLSFRPTLQVCCDDTGAPRDLSSLATLRTQSPPRAHAIGVDAQERIWLAWVDGRLGRAEVRLVELDSATLEPRTRKALVAPIDRIAFPNTRTQALPLVCTTTCRVVVSSFYDLPTGGGGTRIATWAPGERSATVVDLPRDAAGDYRHPQLVGAGFRGDRLAIAYRQSSSAQQSRSLRVVIADKRGRNARLVGSVTLPERSRGQPIWLFAAGTFTPYGFVYGQSYSNYGQRGHILATVVPLR